VHTTCCQVFPYRVYTNSNRCDTLRYEWPLARCYDLIVFDLLMDGSSGYLLYFEDDVDYFIELHNFFHVLVYRLQI
jgi:hypothetical protein